MTASGRARKLPRVVRIVRARPRLFVCAAISLVVIAVLPGDWRWATRFVVGWDIGAAAYLVTAFTAMAGADVAHIRRRSVLMDEGRIMILVLTTGAALMSLGALVIELAEKDIARAPRHLALALVTIALSWALIHTIFALHYAHEFYGDRHERGGLNFPGNEEPDYWDFLYFSLVIGMTSQVSDVGVTAKEIRRVVSAHGVVSFAFNAALIALSVNIAASALAG
jgi:uncharacterized membrane protein